MFSRKKPAPQRTLEQDVQAVAARMGLQLEKIDDNGATFRHGGGVHILQFATLRRLWEGASAEQRPTVVQGFLVALMQSAQSAPAATDRAAVEGRIFPRVVTPDYGVVPMIPPDQQPHHWVLVPGLLSVVLVVDEPNTVWPVSDSHLRSWGWSFEDAYAMAFENLRRRTDASRQGDLPGYPPVKVYQANDSFDAARALLLGDLLVPWPSAGAVFAVPSRDHFAFAPVAGRATYDAIQGLLNAIDFGIQQGAKPLSDQIFWFDGQNFEHVIVSWDPGGVKFALPDRLKETMGP
jgi:hypothetical protein